MGKFEIEFEITGLKLKVKGDRSEVPGMTQALGQQVTNLFKPLNDIVDGEAKVVDDKPSLALPAQTPEEGKKKRKKRSHSVKDVNASGSQAKQQSDAFVELNHKRDTYGYPSQSWNTTDKCIWLIHVLSQETNQTEFTARQLADTFNKYF